MNNKEVQWTTLGKNVWTNVTAARFIGYPISYRDMDVNNSQLKLFSNITEHNEILTIIIKTGSYFHQMYEPKWNKSSNTPDKVIIRPRLKYSITYFSVK